MEIKEIKTVTITEKGQIVIPRIARMSKGFEEGSKITLIVFEDRIELKPINQINEGFSRALISESAFAKDWNSKEDEEAWKDL